MGPSSGTQITQKFFLQQESGRQTLTVCGLKCGKSCTQIISLFSVREEPANNRILDSRLDCGLLFFWDEPVLNRARATSLVSSGSRASATIGLVQPLHPGVEMRQCQKIRNPPDQLSSLRSWDDGCGRTAQPSAAPGVARLAQLLRADIRAQQRDVVSLRVSLGARQRRRW